ncbi:HutD family protein [Ruegeria sp.]|uniref:HutD/Ves family protein n=1 Tax=Ruegeria sp. TaxID=1879320 RepID=UPI003B5B65AB
MRIRLDDCAATPWANGGGVTRELALKRIGDRVVWRISVAEIERDGPFSCFPGLARWHTIIAGAGLDLHGEIGVLKARPFEPLPFDGGLALTARLLEGPCLAFNVIYDPRVVAVHVDVRAGAQVFDVAMGAFVFVASGQATAGGAPIVAGEGFRPEEVVTITLASDATVLHVRFVETPT